MPTIPTATEDELTAALEYAYEHDRNPRQPGEFTAAEYRALLEERGEKVDKYRTYDRLYKLVNAGILKKRKISGKMVFFSKA